MPGYTRHKYRKALKNNDEAQIKAIEQEDAFIRSLLENGEYACIEDRYPLKDVFMLLCKYGRIDVIKKHLDLIRQVVPDIGYGFHEAMAENQLEVVQLLWEICIEQKQQAAKDDQQPLAFFQKEVLVGKHYPYDGFVGLIATAAEENQTDTVKWILAQCEPEAYMYIIRKIKADLTDILSQNAGLFQLIYDKSPEALRQEIILPNCIESLLSFIASGNHELMEKLWHNLPEPMQKNYFKNHLYFYNLLDTTLRKGCIPLFHQLWQQADKNEQFNMIRNSGTLLFNTAINTQPLEFITHLWESCPAELHQTILLTGEDNPLYAAALKGRLDITQWLWKLYPDDYKQEIRAVDNYKLKLFLRALESGNLEVFLFLSEQCDKEKLHRAIYRDRFLGMLIKALAKNARTDTLQWLLEHCPADKKQSIFRDELFYEAVFSASLETIKLIWEHADEHKRSKMLEYSNFKVFDLTHAIKKDPKILDWLWEKTTPPQKYHIVYELNIFNPDIKRMIAELGHDQAADSLEFAIKMDRDDTTILWFLQQGALEIDSLQQLIRYDRFGCYITYLEQQPGFINLNDGLVNVINMFEHNLANAGQHDIIADLICKLIPYIGDAKYLLALADGIGIGKADQPGTSEQLSQLRYRDVSRLKILKSMGYRETNDSEKIANKIFERAEELLAEKQYQVDSEEEFNTYRQIFDRNIMRKKSADMREQRVANFEANVNKAYQADEAPDEAEKIAPK